MGTFQLSCEDALASFTQESKTIEGQLSTKFTTDSNTTCILCEYAMSILVNYIHQNSTEEEIEQSLEKVCNQMPATLRNQCHEFVENYGPSIIATLVREFDVKAICRKLNLCTSQMKVDLSHMTKANQASCGVCDYVSTYIHFALKRDSSDKSLQHALSTVCTHLSSEQTSQCQTIVQLIATDIRQLQLGSGDNFCKKMTICQTPMSELKPAIHLNQELKIRKEEQFKQAIVQNLDETPQCMLCRYVVSYLDAILKENKSEAAIEAALEKVCTILPSMIHQKISKIVLFSLS
jgi:saposin